mmetsp:Transcript_2685/g.3916  ORF Transcript_2685/g.3916 Transcript_2685/m.3916 type:complete len:218 (-) Transcript_2685:287-940(-)
MNLHQNLPHPYTGRKPVFVSVPFAPLAIDFKDVNLSSRVIEQFHCFTERFKFRRIFSSFGLGLNAPRMKVKARTDGCQVVGKVSVSAILLNHIECMDFAVRMYLIANAALELCFSCAPNAVDQASTLDSMRVANPLGTVAHPPDTPLSHACEGGFIAVLIEFCGVRDLARSDSIGSEGELAAGMAMSISEQAPVNFADICKKTVGIDPCLIIRCCIF